MPIYFIITKDDNIQLWSETEIDPAEYGYADGFYEAPTRGKAQAMFFKEYDLEFTEPVNVRKVVDCEYCNNEGTVRGQAEWDTGYYELVECCDCKGKSASYDVRVYEEKS